MGNAGGTHWVHTVRRLPRTEQWDLDMVNSVKISLWGPRTQQPDQQHRLVIPVGIPELPDQAGHEEIIMKDVHIRKSDIMKFGYTVGCRGCTAIRTRTKPQGHDDAQHR